MRSFSRVVQTYADAHASGNHPKFRAMYARWAIADLADIFSRNRWRGFERDVDTMLWGIETATMSSVSGQLVTITGTTNQKWKGQDVVIPGSVTPHRIIRMNTADSFIVDPPYAGATVASGTQATIRQISLGLPSNFGALIDPVLRDQINSRITSPHEMTNLTRGLWSSGYCHTVHGNNLLIWPPRPTRLYFRYRYLPRDMFEYMNGQALVLSAQPDLAIGTGSLWSTIPNAGVGAVFETHDSIVNGMPISYAISVIEDDRHAVLLDDFTGGPLDLAFPYSISSDLNLPPYLDRCVQAKAEWRAKTKDEGFVARAILAAIGADGASDERIGRSPTQTILSVVSGVR